MNTRISILFLLFSVSLFGQNQENRFYLNGIVDFDQTETAFPPENFTRKIPVPGLIDLANPPIDQLEDYYHGKHEPRYSWYKFEVFIENDKKGQFAILKLLKSRYNTQILLNGHDCGTFMQCNTPIDADLTPFINYGEKNELLIRLGDRAWLPKAAATGFDREKYTDIPGIWDDIFIDFGGPIKVHRMLALPSVKENQVTAKIQLENYSKLLERNMEYGELNFELELQIREKETLKIVSEKVQYTGKIGSQQKKELVFEIPLNSFSKWTPDTPFLYELVAKISPQNLIYKNYGNKEISTPNLTHSWTNTQDISTVTFGMRDFEARGRDFYLNDERIHLYGSTITLNRFFEDPQRQHLPWDREWVEKLMITIPKSLDWNFFRVSIGLLPEFWYDLADKHGIMIQNEYLMWNLRGRAERYDIEYTDWIWSDGNHPSIIIWDALNEQKEEYIGNVVIPKLKIIDPTRIWDLGYMKADKDSKLEMNEIHWYPLAHGWWVTDEWVADHIPAFRFGEVTKKYGGMDAFYQANSPIIVNEYGWLWQSRNGKKSGIRTYGKFIKEDITPYKEDYESFELDGSQKYSNRDNYDYFLGKNANAHDRKEFQAYMMALQTEIIRSIREADGVASFAYLSNNNGYTGDWFADIEKLKPNPALLVQKSCMQPFAVFVDLEDGRYLKKAKTYIAGSTLDIPLFVINDKNELQEGSYELQILNSNNEIVRKVENSIILKGNWQKSIIHKLNLPEKEGAYLVVSKLALEDGTSQISQRYILVGTKNNHIFPEIQY